MTDPAITAFPTHIRKEAFKISPEKRKELIEAKFREIMEILGLDLEDESLKKTPYRVAKMFIDEVFSGLDPANFPEIALHTQNIDPNEIILIKNINFVSFCEHHFVPMAGKGYVAYLPQTHILGLSKINRIVRYLSRRPQLQERLTAQIADSLVQILGTENVAVVLIARHFCVAARGVEDPDSLTETRVFRGTFQNDPKRRSELLMALSLNEKPQNFDIKNWEEVKPDSVNSYE